MNRKIATAIVVTTLLVGTGLASAQFFGRRGGTGTLRGVGSGTVEISIYAADPATGVDPIETLTLTRPLSPSDIIANYEGAAFVVVTGESFSRTLDLSEFMVEVAVYAEDPASGAEPIRTISAIQPLKLSEVLAEVDDAAFVVVTGSNFTRTLDLAALEEAPDKRFEHHRGRGGHRGGLGGMHRGLR